MAKISKHNLNFSEEELTGKKAKKLSDDISKVNHKSKPKKEMKIKRNLKFEENKANPSDKLKNELKDEIKDTPRKVVSNNIQNKVSEDAEDNSSVEAADKGSRLVEESARKTRTYIRRQNRNVTDNPAMQSGEERQRLRHGKREMKEEKAADKEAINNLYSGYLDSNPEGKSNPYSRWKQKQEIKKEYYAAKKGNSVTAAGISEKTKSKIKDTVENTENKVINFAKDNKAAVIIAGGLILSLIIGISMFGSTAGVIASSGSGAVGATSYPSEDTEMLSAEKYYVNLEAQLDSTVSTYERTHSYNEYHYSIDEISHDPYELTSLLTAKSDGAYTANQVQGIERTIFNYQYVLSQRVVTETKYKTEYRIRTVYYTNDDGTTGSRNELYSVKVPYTYYICYVTLKNNGIDNAVSRLLTDDQKNMYEIYNEVKGNRDDLF